VHCYNDELKRRSPLSPFLNPAEVPSLGKSQSWKAGRGQVAQVVERSPEKAGVGGSTPSLATIIINDLENQPEISHL
jgi:hypothetical protein